MIIPIKILSRRSLTAALVALAAMPVVGPAAGAAQFRELPALPNIPPSVTFQGERDILKGDLDRLRGRLKSYDAKRSDYRRECAQRLMSNAVRKRRCSFLAQEIHRDGSHLRTEIGALRNRFGTIERNALQRRQSRVPAPGNAAPVAVNDKRHKMVADALSAGRTWRSVLDHVKAMMGRGAGDPSVRDVSAYLFGIHGGGLAADLLENPYYKHGVRRALAGDYWSAALAFAHAARDTPEDLLVFESFADAAGRQHKGPACVKSGRCVSGNISGWVKRFGKRHERPVKQMVAAGQKGKLGHDTLRMLNILRAITVYAAKKDADPAPGPELQEIAARALAALRRGDRLAAITDYIQLWKVAERGRAGLFMHRYSVASGSDTARGLLDDDYPSVTAFRIDDVYLANLKEAFEKGGDASPFNGTLSRAQIIRLQR